MRSIGLLGGMSWESTVTYYQLLNRIARERLGGLHSAKILLWSFDFAEIEAMQSEGDWAGATEVMIHAARALETGGADCVVICTNTMHKIAAEVQHAIAVPLIHIAEATATAINKSGVEKPLLLATRYTMEEDFYKGHLQRQHAIEVAIPSAAGRTIIHDIIYKELCQGIINSESKLRYLDIISEGIANGADSVIFGCTEVGLLITPGDIQVPTFDTTRLHAKAALDFALSDSP